MNSREHADLSDYVDNAEFFRHRRNTTRERSRRKTDVASHGAEKEGL